MSGSMSIGEQLAAVQTLFSMLDLQMDNEEVSVTLWSPKHDNGGSVTFWNTDDRLRQVLRIILGEPSREHGGTYRTATWPRVSGREVEVRAQRWFLDECPTCGR